MYSAPADVPRGTRFDLQICHPKDREYEWWEEVGHVMGDSALDTMTWTDFSARFRAEFAPVIEVQ